MRIFERIDSWIFLKLLSLTDDNTEAVFLDFLVMSSSDDDDFLIKGLYEDE